jgi:hypothetical protein
LLTYFKRSINTDFHINTSSQHVSKALTMLGVVAGQFHMLLASFGDRQAEYRLVLERNRGEHDEKQKIAEN